MDLLCTEVDSCRLDCDLSLDIWLIFHKFQGMDLYISDYYRLDFVRNQNLQYTRDGKLVGFQCILERKSKQVDRLFDDIENWGRKEMDYKDLFQPVLRE